MTRKVSYYARCRKCDVDGICPECGEKIERFSSFSDWLRGLSAPLDSSSISLHNLDYIWHNYREDWFITMEEKQNGGACSKAQRDTHAIVFQFLNIASKILKMTHGYVKSTLRNMGRQVEYRGHYVIVFERTCPDDSAWIRINDNETDKGGLLRLLRTGRVND